MYESSAFFAICGVNLTLIAVFSFKPVVFRYLCGYVREFKGAGRGDVCLETGIKMVCGVTGVVTDFI